MNKSELKDMIKEALQEVIASKYNTIDKVLNDLLAMKITKAQAKKYIAIINASEKVDTQTWGNSSTCGGSNNNSRC